MENKKELDCTTQRGWGLAIGLVVGLLVGFGVGVFSSDWAIKSGARWWEVMTAFGTVGATIAAVTIAARSESINERNRIWRGMTLKWFLAFSLGDVLAGAKICKEELDRLSKLPAGEFVDEIELYAIRSAVDLLDLSDLQIHLDNVHVIGNNAHCFAKVIALTKAKHQRLKKLVSGRLYVSPDSEFLSKFSAEFAELLDETEKAIELLNHPV